jgi:hypothetical protein
MLRVALALVAAAVALALALAVVFGFALAFALALPLRISPFAFALALAVAFGFALAFGFARACRHTTPTTLSSPPPLGTRISHIAFAVTLALTLAVASPSRLSLRLFRSRQRGLLDVHASAAATRSAYSPHRCKHPRRARLVDASNSTRRSQSKPSYLLSHCQLAEPTQTLLASPSNTNLASTQTRPTQT